MSYKSRTHRNAFVVWVVVVALLFSVSPSLIQAQDDDEEELSLEELQEQRELAAEQLANAALLIDVNTATIEELADALDEIDALASIQQLRLEEATDRYLSALDRQNRAEASHDEVLEEIHVLRLLVADLALAQFTGESGTEVIELALSADLGLSARLSHLLELQTGSAEDAVDRLRILEFEAEELLEERNIAFAVAEESLREMEFRSGEVEAAVGQQEELLRSAESRLARNEEDAEEAARLIEETEERLISYFRGIGAPAPVDRADIVTISFFEGAESTPFFQIQVHKDIEEQTRALYQLAFSQGINLGGWGFRTTERQIELRQAHCGDSDYDIWLRPASQCSPPTARPGYSKHEQGRAIDFQWNGGSIGPRSGEPFRWLAANAPQFGFVNLPSEPWHWSDGTATTFDPTVPVPDLADAVPEVEPDEATAEVLNGDLDENGELIEGAEAPVDADAEPVEGEPVDGEQKADEAAPPQAPLAADDGAAAEQPPAEPVQGEPVPGDPSAGEDPAAVPVAEPAAPEPEPEPAAEPATEEASSPDA